MESTTAIKITVSESIGKVSAELTEPKSPHCVMTFAHGAGAGMQHPFMTGMSEELAGSGIATLRFNFPYMESRKNRPDVPAVAHKAIDAAAAKARKLKPELPLLLSGKSFGGRMSSQYLSGEHADFIRGVVFFGFPLHAPGKASVDRADHLKTVKVPMLFLQGSRDDLAKWDLIESVCKPLKNATLIRFEGADHSFRVSGKKTIVPELAAAVAKWIEELDLHK
jgi:predicted alpha/beta-hydrolase family hydrolase